MATSSSGGWQERLVGVDEVLRRIKPGMRIFAGTGAAEPGTLLRGLMASEAGNLRDLEIVQLASLGDALFRSGSPMKFRLKTFFSGWVAEQAITSGKVDLIPGRFSQLPALFGSGQIPVDAAFVQVTPPDKAGYVSLSMAVDVARQAIDQASLVVGEVSEQVPCTYGDTFVPASEFDLFVRSEDPPITFDRWPVDPVIDRVAAVVASLVEDGSCLAFSIGPIFEALGARLRGKSHLGIHSPFFTDALMDLVTSGAVSNARKAIFRGKSVTSYALGTTRLLDWLDRNPLVEFQAIDKVFDAIQIGRNPRFVAILPVRKVDLNGRFTFHVGRGNVPTSPGEAADIVSGARMSEGGCVIVALPSRNREHVSNVLASVESLPGQFCLWEAIDMIATEWGVANLAGRTLRERAQAIIEIAHPDDRYSLFEQAKAMRILFEDQIFLAESSHLYPSEVGARETFGGEEVRFRAVRPSDEEEMRRFFYRFSDDAVYHRFHSHVRTMPHERMQEYVNVDYRRAMSIVGLVGEPGRGKIVAEARYVAGDDFPVAELAFLVDGDYQRRGLATFLFGMLIKLGRERGIQEFSADVMVSNTGIIKVLESGGLPLRATLENGLYRISIPLDLPT